MGWTLNVAGEQRVVGLLISPRVNILLKSNLPSFNFPQHPEQFNNSPGLLTCFLILEIHTKSFFSK